MTETLDQIARIVDTLEPLADATPGEPVRAEDWNAVVASVVDLARVALTRERTIDESLAAGYAPAGHQHLGAVALGWLDPVARDLVEGGRSQRADLAAELDRTRRDLVTVQTENRALTERVAALERRLSTLDDRDFDRSQRLDRLGGAVDTIGETETSLADLRRTFAAVDERVGEALALRDELVDVTGQRLDLAALRSDVDALNEIGERLRTADGSVVEIRAFEQRLAQVEARVDSGPGGGGPVFDLDAFRDQVLFEADARTLGRLEPVRDEIAALDSRVDVVAADVDRAQVQISDQAAALAAVRTQTNGIPALTNQVATLQSRVNDQQVRIDGLEQLPRRLDQVESRLERVEPLSGRVAVLESNVATMRTAVERIPQLEQRLVAIEGVRGDVNDLRTRLDATSAVAQDALSLAQNQGTRLTAVEAGVADQTARLVQVETLSRSHAETLRRLGSERPIVGGGTIGGGTVGGGVISGPVIRPDIGPSR